MAVFKVSADGLELFYRECEKALFPVSKRSAKYGYCGRCMLFYRLGEAAGRCPSDGTKLRVRPRKRKNGTASRVSISPYEGTVLFPRDGFEPAGP